MLNITGGETKQQQFTLSERPSALTFNQAVELLVQDDLYLEALDFYHGEHWKDGKYWIGPRLDPNDEEADDVMAEVGASLVTHPGVEQTVDRKKDALLGRPGNFTVTLRRTLKKDEKPTEEEERVMAEANQALVNWYDDKEVLGVLDEAELDLELGRRGLMRLIVPESELLALEDGTTVFPRGRTFQECLGAIWPVHAPADQAVVLRDSVTMREVGIFVYEVVDVLTGRPTQVAEISYVDDQGRTVIRTVGVQRGRGGTENDEVVDFGTSVLDLNGRLSMFEMRNKKPLVTKPMLANQKALNVTLTMMCMNSILAGFLERVVLNGQKPGEWIIDEEAEGGKRFEEAAYKTGPRTTQWLVPKQLGIDPVTKAPVFGNVDIKWRDPVEIQTFIDGALESYKNILECAHQLHVLISGDAVASGESRKQARDDYEKSLKKDKVKLDKSAAWLLETALHWAAVLEGKPGKYKDYRVVYDTKIDAGPLAAADRAAIREEYAADLRTWESTVIELRITDDPEALLADITKEQDPEHPLQKLKDRKVEAALKLAQSAQPNQGGGTGGKGKTTGTKVRKGTGRSKEKAAD